MTHLRLPILLALFALASAACRSTGDASGRSAMLAHDVYFTLQDDSPEACRTLVDACNRWLSGLPGIEFFATGTREDELTGEVNDLEFDVSLHVFFVDRAAHDAYQTAENHLAFIEENKANWAGVRVFDSMVQGR
jgi:hypothetical protein